MSGRFLPTFGSRKSRLGNDYMTIRLLGRYWGMEKPIKIYENNSIF